MQTDEEIGKVAQAVPVIIYILFKKYLLNAADGSTCHKTHGLLRDVSVWLLFLGGKVLFHSYTIVFFLKFVSILVVYNTP